MAGRPAPDISGQRFGRWLVIKRDGKIGPASAFLCQCDCGTRRRVNGWHLKGGRTKSCGCLMREIVRDKSITHGGTKHPLYKTWRKMRDRCLRTNEDAYPHYGGRGISICERWLDFANFRDDLYPTWRPGLTLERISNDGDYEPDNCRWATRVEQGGNKRNNVVLESGGKQQSLSAWAREIGISPGTLWARINNSGWTVERALTEPKRAW